MSATTGRVCFQCRQPTAKPLRRELCPACYQRNRIAGTLAGGAGLVDAARTVAHLAALEAAGIGQREVARRTGLNRLAIGKISRGRRAQVNVATETAILAIAIPESPDLAAIAWRELCAAGARGDYVSPQRKYRATMQARRKLALRQKVKRDELRRLRQEEHAARVRELLGPPPAAPVDRMDATAFDLSRVACGGCDVAPCRCPDDDTYDLAWLPTLADHDHPAIFDHRTEGLAA